MSAPSDNVQADLYDGTVTSNDYALLPGVCVLPLAEDPPTDAALLADYSPVVIARLHAPYRIRSYKCSSSKQNNPPVMPSPSDKGKFVFVGGTLSFTNQLNSTFWNFDWSAQAAYLFVENCVSRPQDGFVLGSYTQFTNKTDQSAANNYGTTGPTVGAVSGAGPAAVAGYNYGQLIAGLPSSSQDTGDNVSHGLVQRWNYTMSAFYPGTLLNDNLANGSVV